jgi:hypothetical protein
MIPRFWKMDHRDKPGDDDYFLEEKNCATWVRFPSLRSAGADSLVVRPYAIFLS